MPVRLSIFSAIFLLKGSLPSSPISTRQLDAFQICLVFYSVSFSYIDLFLSLHIELSLPIKPHSLPNQVSKEGPFLDHKLQSFSISKMQRSLLNGNSQNNNPYRNEDRSRNNPYNNQNQTSSRPGMSQRPSNHLPLSSRAQPPPPIQISPSQSNYPESRPRLQSQTNAYTHNPSNANQDWVGGVELGISPSSSDEHHGLRSYGSSNSLNGGVYSSSSNSHGFGSSSSNLSHTDYDPDFSSNENVIGEYAINSPVWYQDSQDDGATRGLLSSSNSREDGFYSNPTNPGFGRSGIAVSRI